MNININCERCNNDIVIPINMPESNNELIRLLKDKFNFKKPIVMPKKIFAKYIKRNYIRFKCPSCGWEKITELNELILNGFIDTNICKNCDSEICLWIKCKNGGYIKK